MKIFERGELQSEAEKYFWDILAPMQAVIPPIMAEVREYNRKLIRKYSKVGLLRIKVGAWEIAEGKQKSC